MQHVNGHVVTFCKLAGACRLGCIRNMASEAHERSAPAVFEMGPVACALVPGLTYSIWKFHISGATAHERLSSSHRRASPYIQDQARPIAVSGR